MNKTIKFVVDEENSGKRIDIYLSKKIVELSRSYIKKLVEEGQVKINDITTSASSTKIKDRDKIIVKIIEKKSYVLTPKKIKLDIVFEDKDILIINKPKGMVVHPGAGNYKNTLVNALLYKYKDSLSDINGSTRPGIVHRIDKETSGLLVIAKNNLAHSNLGKQFSDHSIKRKYQCLAWGIIRPLNGSIKTLISRNKKNRQLMTVSDVSGKKAVTNYKTIKVFNIKDIPKISLIECKLETGRTHQIRVHLKYKGSSLLGDKQYGKKNIKFKKINKEFFNKLSKLNGQALHAQTLEFIHPIKKKIVSFKSNLPLDFKKMLDLLNNLSG
ncbi:RluA family pseudouridine synthase [Pelagibacteraceae bacterium]|jgi:23S rRNA pseudouridine1911/1915/1917 synthase|nr:RluA family pseudouridine synthase [Pelagibacteraceae bacterium]MDC0529689.1 RluA family pseudouridine synthase [Pelagibacteraceae bacterium]